MFFEIRVLTPSERETCEHNCEIYDHLFRFCSKRCANPHCKFPLSALVEHNFSMDFNGKVCNLCHVMEAAARAPLKLNQRWTAWKEEKEKDIARKKKIMDDKNYF